MAAVTPPFDISADPLIAEAKQRARRRRLSTLAAAGLIAVGLLAFELASAGTGGGAHGANGTIPWLPMKPNIGPANPPLAPACTASQLGATLSMQGASMSLVGPISIVNRSSAPCSLLVRPKLSFAGATSKWRETRYTMTSLATPSDPLAPPIGSLRALRAGEHVLVTLWWSNWCGRGSNDLGNSGRPARAMLLTAPGGGRIPLHNGLRRSFFAPVCNGGPGSVSTLQAGNFRPFVPQGPPSLALPLKASIVSAQPLDMKAARIPEPTLVARAGRWLSFTVVLTNTGKRVFHFGRTCPAYTEGVTAQNQAYVLNCHTVGAIAPRGSVRFAMRAHIPANASSLDALGWTLAPHSYNAPQTMAILKLH